MVKSLLVWALAAGIVDDKRQLTARATQIFIEHDPFLEKPESIALLHWLISANTRHYTANTWLFNYCLTPTFSTQDALVGFHNYLTGCGKKYAEGTIKSDIETAIRTHVSVHEKKRDIIDDKFFLPLRLLSKRKVDGRTVFSRTWESQRYHVSQKLLFYTIIQSLSKRRSAKASMMADLYSAQPGYAAPGVVFGLTKDGFFTMIEDLAKANAKKIMLTPMPGGDLTVQLKGPLAKRCEAGDENAADQFFFGRLS